MKKISSLILLLTISIPLQAAQKAPQLIVQIVVDQLRGDLLSQYQAKFGRDGFNYLLSHSLNYQNAHHPHAHTVTCAGHATIATGAYPSLHGIIANDWFNIKTGKNTYCMEDKNSPILSNHAPSNPSQGRSPQNLVTSTLSDELILAQKGRAFGVSFKDRSAITLAGHAGKAFWFDKQNGGFVSSRYYYQHYPAWVSLWNQENQPTQETWALSQAPQEYRYAKTPSTKPRIKEIGEHFPHHLGKPTSRLYYPLFSITPFADELAADFAIQLLKEEKLGTKAGQTDYLGISFSGVDAIGHQFGPNSLESEDALLRLDKSLAKLLSAIEKQTGLANTLVVLTADHGVTDSPAYLKSHNISENPPLTVKNVRETIQKALLDMKLPPETLLRVSLPYVYLNHALIHDHVVTIQSVKTALSERLNTLPNVFKVYTLPVETNDGDWLGIKVAKMAFPGRTGDLYILPPPYQAVAYKKEPPVLHGSPWNYDSFVPLLFVNPLFKAKKITKPVYTTDIASTLAAILQIKAPSGAVGEPLGEVMRFYE